MEQRKLNFEYQPELKTLFRIVMHSVVLQKKLYFYSRDYVDDTLKEKDYFGFKKMITIDDLFHARVHYGHKVN